MVCGSVKIGFGFAVGVVVVGAFAVVFGDGVAVVFGDGAVVAVGVWVAFGVVVVGVLGFKF